MTGEVSSTEFSYLDGRFLMAACKVREREGLSNQRHVRSGLEGIFGLLSAQPLDLISRVSLIS